MTEQIIINRHHTKELSKDEVLTAENVKFRGERTAVCAVKSILGYVNDNLMQRTYRNLLKDIDNFDAPDYTLTESYDIAQEAIMFLCGHIGQKLTDLVVTEKGERITVLKACFKTVNLYIHRSHRIAVKTIQPDDKRPFQGMPYHEIAVPFEWDLHEEEDYSGVKKRIKAMRLTLKQKQVLSCRMSGQNISQTARALSVIPRSIKTSLKYIQMKYYNSFKHISYCTNLQDLNLTDYQRRVFELYLKGERIKEIAEILSVNRQAVSKSLKRVQKKMQFQTI